MCLYPNSDKPKKAKEDIQVWKCISKDGGGFYHNLFINDNYEPWTKGFEYSEPDFLLEARDFGEISGNAFHSNKTRQNARDMSYISQIDSKVVKMIIPKGSWYYESANEYASNRIIYPKL